MGVGRVGFPPKCWKLRKWQQRITNSALSSEFLTRKKTTAQQQQDFHGVLNLIAFSATHHCRPGGSSCIVSLIMILVNMCVINLVISKRILVNTRFTEVTRTRFTFAVFTSKVSWANTNVVFLSISHVACPMVQTGVRGARILISKK